jgi:hypothetical protein
VELTLFTNLLGAIGLGAASGLNAWIPLLGLGIAERLGLVTLTAPFDQLGSNQALAVLSIVFVIDLIGDKVAVIDHAATGAVIGGSVHLARSAVRPAVTAGTGGVGNPFASAFEDVVSLFVTILAILVPVLAFLVVVAGTVVLWRRVRRWRRRRAARLAEAPVPPDPPSFGPRAIP